MCFNMERSKEIFARKKSKEVESSIVNENAFNFECITKCILEIMCSNSVSHCKVDQKKTVAISHMFNYVQLYVHWMHLLIYTRICRYTYITPTVIYCDKRQVCKEVIQH